MRKTPKKPASEKQKPGPEAERFKIDGNWEDAVKRSFQAKKPPGGWPKPDQKKSQPKN